VTQPRILVIAMGGTIASVGEAGVVPSLSPEALLAAVPELTSVARIEARSFRQLPSGDLRLEDVVALAQVIRQAQRDGVDGVVVTHGTDSLEESAFALDVLVDSPLALVVTGALRHPQSLSPDGPANLAAAVRVAASPAARGQGCLVVVNEEVHAARFVRKAHASNVAAFASAGPGPLGWVSEGRVRISSRLAPLAHLDVAETAPLAPVALVSVSLGDDGRMLSAISSLGYRGLVLEGFGAGHVPGAMVAGVAELVRAMPVVITSRTGAGEVLSATYGFAGSERDLLARGVVSGGALDSRKARVALGLALSATGESASAVELFGRLRDSMSL